MIELGNRRELFVDRFLIDRLDGALADPIRALGVEVEVTDTIMTDAGSRALLAREMLVAAAWAGAEHAEARHERASSADPHKVGRSSTGGADS